MGKSLEQLLVNCGVTTVALEKARQRQAEKGGSLRENLFALGELSADAFAKHVMQSYRVPYVNLEQIKIPDDVLQLISRENAEKYLALPLKFDEKHRRLSITMAEPSDMSGLDELKFVIGYTLVAHYTPEDELRE